MPELNIYYIIVNQTIYFSKSNSVISNVHLQRSIILQQNAQTHNQHVFIIQQHTPHTHTISR